MGVNDSDGKANGLQPCPNIACGSPRVVSRQVSPVLPDMHAMFCSACGLRGPAAPNTTAARNRWNNLPRGGTGLSTNARDELEYALSLMSGMVVAGSRLDVAKKAIKLALADPAALPEPSVKVNVRGRGIELLKKALLEAEE